MLETRKAKFDTPASIVFPILHSWVIAATFCARVGTSLRVIFYPLAHLFSIVLFPCAVVRTFPIQISQSPSKVAEFFTARIFSVCGIPVGITTGPATMAAIR